jgi:ubiquinone/menaquinone biosynthesis C-methylase UbiE
MDQERINSEWSESSENYDNIIQAELRSFRPAAWQKQILSRFDSGRKLRILDIGCGPGFFTIILSEKGHEVTGIDGAYGMLEKARRNVAASGYASEIVEMDANDLKFEDNTFDLIVSRNVTHTIQDHVKAYSEWKRVLKEGGVLLIYDANWHHIETVPEVRKRYIRDWKKCVSVYGSDFNGNTDPEGAPHMDDIEGGHPLGDIVRPDYDIGILKAIGFKKIEYKRDIISSLWDEKEKTLYGCTPMFEISAIK